MSLFVSQTPVLLVALPLLCVPLLYFFEHALALSARPTALVMHTALMLLALLAASIPLSEAGSIAVAVGGWPADLGIELELDRTARLFLPAIAGLGLLGVMAARARHSTSTYYTLFFLLLAGSNGLILSRDLFNVYVFIEITSIASYALVGFRQDRRGFESAFKYLIVGSLASLLILWGIAGLYVSAGSLSLPILAQRLGDSPQRFVAGSGALITAGLLVKLGIAPFHAWKPDAMAGAPSAVAATLSGATVTAFFLLFVRVYMMLRAVGVATPLVLGVFAGASIVVGHFMALRQTRLPRLLAYSSVAHFGYILGGLVAGTQAAIAAALLHALHHGFMKAGLFYYASLPPAYALQGADTPRRLAWLPTAALVILSMGMIGIPPTAGFSSKWLIVLETARADSIHPVFAGVLAGLVALGGAIALMYYLRVALVMRARKALRSEPGVDPQELLRSEPGVDPQEPPASEHPDRRQLDRRRSALALGVCVAYTLVAFWFTDALGGFAAAAAAQLMEL